jgi:hypothetical protein
MYKADISNQCLTPWMNHVQIYVHGSIRTNVSIGLPSSLCKRTKNDVQCMGF